MPARKTTPDNNNYQYLRTDNPSELLEQVMAVGQTFRKQFPEPLSGKNKHEPIPLNSAGREFLRYKDGTRRWGRILKLIEELRREIPLLAVETEIVAPLSAMLEPPPPAKGKTKKKGKGKGKAKSKAGVSSMYYS